jgi:pilus assembly protein FimV
VAEEPGFFTEMLERTTTQLALGASALLLLALFGWGRFRRAKAEDGERFKDTGEGLRANSLFGTTGGRNVDTGTSTFNSSFVPAASSLDSNEVDPVAEADVYIAYGREEQAEEILKEALRLAPDRHPVRVKLLEIYSHRGDRASFDAMIDELHQRTGGAGEDWERAAKLGYQMDPVDPRYASAERASRGGAASERRVEAAAAPLPKFPPASAARESRDPGPLTVPPLTSMAADDVPSEVLPSHSTLAAPSTRQGPPTKPAPEPVFAAASDTGAPTDLKTVSLETGFGALDFDLGPTKMQFGATEPGAETTSPTSSLLPPAAAAAAAQKSMALEPLVTAAPVRVAPPVLPAMDFDLELPARTTPSSPAAAPMLAEATTGVGVAAMRELDLSPPTESPGSPTLSPEAELLGPRTLSPTTLVPTVLQSGAASEVLSRPTVLSAVGQLGDGPATRLTSSTDQATVPMIDFDLSAMDAPAGETLGRAEPGSALAQQMATKLDLARGYLDLGVRDGARELLDEVMRDGTREQRAAAVDLIRQVES